MGNTATILFTQPLTSGTDLAERLAGKVGQVLRFPLIETRPTPVQVQDQQLLDQLSDFTWLVFTSKNGVYYFFEQLKAKGLTYPNCRTAVIGNKTASELVQKGVTCDYINQGNTSAEFVPALKRDVLTATDKVLVVLGVLAPDLLEVTLADYCSLTRWNVYETVHPNTNVSELYRALTDTNCRAILFTSPSAIRRAKELLLGHWSSIENKAVCIGATTAKALAKSGIHNYSIAKQPTTEALFDTIMSKVN